MPEMTPIRKIHRQTLAPAAAEAASAPEMDAITGRRPRRLEPVSAASRERERRVREEYERLHRRYGTSRYLSRARRAETVMKEPPPTPVSDVAKISMRPLGEAPGLISLEELAIGEEQRKRETHISKEAVRAAQLEPILQYEVLMGQYYEQLNRYNQQLQEYNQALAAKRELDKSVEAYGFTKYEDYMAYIQEMKYTQHLNRLGAALKESELIARAYARGDINDPTEQLREQMRRIETEAKHLKSTWSVDVGPEPQMYMGEVSDYVSEITALRKPETADVTTDTGYRVYPITVDYDYNTKPPSRYPDTTFGQIDEKLSKYINLPHIPEEDARTYAKLWSATGATPASRALQESGYGLVYGAYEGVRSKPLTGLASFGIGLLGGAALKGASKVPQLAKAAPKVVRGLESLWFGSIAGRTAVGGLDTSTGKISPDFFGAGRALGEIITTEAAPVIAGGVAGQRAATITGDIVRTRGLPEIPTTDLVRPEILAGKETFPVEPPGAVSPKELVSKFEVAGRPIGVKEPGGYHATTAPFPPETPIQMGKRPYEGGGLSIAPEISPHFTRLSRGGTKFDPFDISVLPGTPSDPTVLYIKPSAGIRTIPSDIPRSGMEDMARFMLSPQAERGAAYIAPKYEAGWKTGRMESEAMIPVGTQTKRVRDVGYIRLWGRRVPIEERIAYAPTTEPTLPTSTKASGDITKSSRSPYAPTVKPSLLTGSSIASVRPSQIGISPSMIGIPPSLLRPLKPKMSKSPSAKPKPSRPSVIVVGPSPQITKSSVSIRSSLSTPPILRSAPKIRISKPTVSRVRPISSPDIDIGITSPTLPSRPRLGPSARPPRRLTSLDDKPRKGRWPWEWLGIGYRERATPHARLESAYLNLPDVFSKRTVDVKNIGRIRIPKRRY